MTKIQIEKKLRELLSVKYAVLLFREDQFVISVPSHESECCGIGPTLQQAIFNYDRNLERKTKGIK